MLYGYRCKSTNHNQLIFVPLHLFRPWKEADFDKKIHKVCGIKKRNIYDTIFLAKYQLPL